MAAEILWKQQPVSEEQRKAILLFCHQLDISPPDFDQMTKGEACEYIDKQLRR